MDNRCFSVKYKILLDNIVREEEKRQRIIASGDRTIAPNLDAVSHSLDEYYFVYKLNTYCAYLSYKDIVHSENVPYQRSDFLLISSITQLIEKQQLWHPAILIYNEIRILFEDTAMENTEQEVALRKCIDLIKDYESDKEMEECVEMYSMLNNYCIKKINNGSVKYKVFLWELNHHIIQLRYKKEKTTYIEPNLFRNMVIVAIALRRHSVFSNVQTYEFQKVDNGIEWADQFINFHANELEENILGSIHLQYCKAYLEFERHNFARAYKIFNNKMRVQNTFINLSMKSLHLKILYEVNIRKAKILEYDKIEIRQVLDAFRKLIKYETNTRKAMSYQLNIYVDFLAKYRKLLHFFYRYYSRLNNQKSAKFIENKQVLKAFIEKTNYTHNDWFLKKLLEIS